LKIKDWISSGGSGRREDSGLLSCTASYWQNSGAEEVAPGVLPLMNIRGRKTSKKEEIAVGLGLCPPVQQMNITSRGDLPVKLSHPGGRNR
jgi:hypothetical protein